MQFLIVLAAAIACAVAEPQVGYSYSSVAGYPAGYPVGYHGYPGSVGYTAPVAYTATAPVAYTATAPVAYSGATYPYGYSGVYPGYAGVYPSVYDKTVEFKSRAKRAAVFPASTTKLETVAPVHYTAPIAYTSPLGYAAPVAYSAYHGAYPVAAKAYDYKTYSPVAYQYPGYAYGHGYSYGSPVVAY